MTLNFTATFKDTYIHVEHPRGCELTEQGITEFLQELAEICRERQCFKVLVFCVAPKRTMSVMNSFGSGEAASQHLSGVKLAFCFQEYEPDDQTEFFFNVAHNRGLNIALFTEEKEALYWLVGSLPEPDKPGES